MARDHARVNANIWNDPDFLALPPPAQHLYFVLWTHPGLSYCGVVDWRLRRIAERAQGWAVEDVQTAAECLRARWFIVTDEGTEECLIRSWVRWDELMKQPRLGVSYANAFGAVSSKLIRGVMADELHRLRDRDTNLPGLSQPKVRELFAWPRVSAKESVVVTDPFGDGLGDSFGVAVALGSGQKLGSVCIPPTPVPVPVPISKESEPRKRGIRLPDGWDPDPAVRQTIDKQFPQLDLDSEHEKFADYWRAQPSSKGVKLDWDATWRNWMRRAAEDTRRPARTLQPVEQIPAYYTPPAAPRDSLPW